MVIADGRIVLIGFANDLQSNLNTFNDSVKENEHESEMIQRFNELLKFHSDAKQLSEFEFLFRLITSNSNVVLFSGLSKIFQKYWNLVLLYFFHGASHRYSVLL